jgi:hypothetical protein
MLLIGAFGFFGAVWVMAYLNHVHEDLFADQRWWCFPVFFSVVVPWFLFSALFMVTGAMDLFS